MLRFISLCAALFLAAVSTLTPAFAQNAWVSVPFVEGFIGTIGSSNRSATNVTTFATLGVSSVRIGQYSNTGRFESPTGNDIPVYLVFRKGYEEFRIPGTINWKMKSGNTLLAYGFTASPSHADYQEVDLTYSGGTIRLDGTSNFGIVLISQTLAQVGATDGADVSGSNDPVALSDLNDYLDALGTQPPLGPVTVTSQSTYDLTPVISGTAIMAAGETLRVWVNGIPYDAGTDFVVGGDGNWSLQIPDGAALTPKTYSISAIILDPATGNSIEDGTDSELTVLSFTPTPELTVTKTADQGAINSASAGDRITYTVTATNSGNVALTDVTLASDTVTGAATLGLSDANGPVLTAMAADAGNTASTDNGTDLVFDSLAVGEAVTFTVVYDITDADIVAGGVSNVASVSAKDPDLTTITGSVASENAASTALSADAPSIALVKTATLNHDDGTPGVSAGDTIDYTFTVTNTGTVTLTDITIDDPLVTVSGGPLASLAVGASDSVTFSASYTITQDDVDAGAVSNQATVSANAGATKVTDTSGNTEDDDDATVTTVAGTAAIALVKTATLNDDDGTAGGSAGDTIDYAFTVINTGTVTLTDITINDPLVAVSGGPLARLAVGASDSATFSASYTITQDDVDAGGVSNQATASAKAGEATVTDSSGNTQDDDDATETVLSANAAIALIKTATLNDDDGTYGVSAGDSIDYVFTVVNKGSLTLTNITINDPLVAVTGGPLASLAVGVTDSTTFKARYIVTAADVAAGSVSNQATVTAQTPTGTVEDASGSTVSTDDVTVTPLGSITGGVTQNGTARANITVTLTGPGGAVLATTTTDANGLYSFISLPAGEYCVRFDYTGSEAVRAGALNGDGVASGDRVCGLDIVEGAGSNISDVDAILIDPQGVVYDAATRAPIAGATVTLLYGGSPVPDAWLSTDGDPNGHITGADGVYSFLFQSPAPTGAYTLQVSAPDYVTSSLLPVAGASYTPAQGLGVEEIVASTTAPAVGGDTTYYTVFNMTFSNWSDPLSLSKGVIHNHVPLDPSDLTTAITLTKTADVSGVSAPAQIGDVIAYRIEARNTGRVPLAAPSLNDPLTSDEALVSEAGVTDDNELDPGETWVWTASYSLVEGDISAGKVDNMATLTGTDVTSAPYLLESAPTGNATAGAGNGTATSVSLAGLIPQIEEDLEKLINDDIQRAVSRVASKADGYAKDAATALRRGIPDDCGAFEREDERSLDIAASDGNIRAQGHFLSESYDCLAREWRTDEVEISHTQVDGAGGQTVLQFSHRVMRMPDEDSVRGHFYGLYTSRSEIEGLATGSITGVGVTAGLFGAERLKGDLILDYSLGIVAGHHRFSLTFPRSVDIFARGRAQYLGLYGGLGLSGEFRHNDLIIAPRVSLTGQWTTGADVEVRAYQSGVRDAGSLIFGSTHAYRVTAEVDVSNDLTLAHDGKGAWDDLDVELTLTPSLFCGGSSSSAATCGAGFGVSLRDISADGRSRTTAEFKAELTRDTQMFSLSLGRERPFEALPNGTVSQNLSYDTMRGLAVGLEVKSTF